MTDNWRLIETAPHDRPLLLWLGKAADRKWVVSQIDEHLDFIAIGFWQHGRWVSIEVEDCGSMGGEYTGWMADWCPLGITPTHWMPLPQSPKIEE
jgi:hypothetical protein